jgi:hypothetical protein
MTLASRFLYRKGGVELPKVTKKTPSPRRSATSWRAKKENPMIRHERISQLAQKLRTRDQEVEQAAANLSQFTGLFYSAVEEVIDALHKEGITTIQPPERERLADGREQLSFVERDYRFVFVPYQDVAFPALGGCGMPDELVDELGQKRAGRLVAFYHSLEDPDEAKVLCSFYVFADECWCVCGTGHSEHRSLNSQEIADYVLWFFDLIQDGFKKHWRSLHDISLSVDSSTKPETRFHIPYVAPEEQSPKTRNPPQSP